jgi:hypothetical protein
MAQRGRHLMRIARSDSLIGRHPRYKLPAGHICSECKTAFWACPRKSRRRASFTVQNKLSAA